MTLEDLVAKASPAGQALYRYSVDVASGWCYYTPIYALQEALAGKDAETIVKTRLIGLVAHAIAMRPIGKVRNYVAQRWNVTSQSPVTHKMLVNLIGVTPIQAVVYGGMLYGGMAWSGNYDWKASGIAWGLGVGLGAIHAIPYGYFQDVFRKMCGVAPAIKSNPVS